MKTLNPNSSESIVSTRRFPGRSGRHDRWLMHAVDVWPVFVVTGSSGNTFLFSSAQLLSAQIFYYLIGPCPVPPPDPSLVVAFDNFVTPGLSGWWQGEAYNFIVRPLCGQKMTQHEYDAYVLSH